MTPQPENPAQYDVAAVREALEAHVYSGRTYDAEHPLVRAFAALDRLSERIAQLERERDIQNEEAETLSDLCDALRADREAVEARAAAYEEALEEIAAKNPRRFLNAYRYRAAVDDVERKIQDALQWLCRYAEENDEPYLVTEAIADLYYALKFLGEARSV